jgi:hypothetical protein
MECFGVVGDLVKYRCFDVVEADEVEGHAALCFFQLATHCIIPRFGLVQRRSGDCSVMAVVMPCVHPIGARLHLPHKVEGVGFVPWLGKRDRSARHCLWQYEK